VVLFSDYFSEALRASTTLPLKEAAKVGWIVEKKMITDLGNGQVRMDEQSFCLEDESLSNDFSRWRPGYLLDHVGEASRTDTDLVCIQVLRLLFSRARNGSDLEK